MIFRVWRDIVMQKQNPAGQHSTYFVLCNSSNIWVAFRNTERRQLYIFVLRLHNLTRKIPLLSSKNCKYDHFYPMILYEPCSVWRLCILLLLHLQVQIRNPGFFYCNNVFKQFDTFIFVTPQISYLSVCAYRLIFLVFNEHKIMLSYIFQLKLHKSQILKHQVT